MRRSICILLGVFSAGVVGLAVPLRVGSAGPESPRTVVVTVVEAGSKPVAGARVSVLLEPVELGNLLVRGPCRLAGATTDAKGVAVLPTQDPTLRVRLIVTPPDARWRELADAWRLDWSPADTTVTLPGAQVLRGVVNTKDGKPVPLARVYYDASPWMGETTAGPDGTFVVENLPPGRVRLRAEFLPPADGQWQGPLSQLVETATSAQGVVLRFERDLPDRSPGVVTPITTPGGRPVAHALCCQVTRSAGAGGTELGTTVVHLEDGVVRTSPGDALSFLEVFGARTELGEPLACGPAARRGGPVGSGEGGLRLPEGLSIEGHALRPDGSPAPGVRVLAYPARNTSYGGGTSGYSGQQHGEGVSGADGSFRVEGLEERWYRLRAAWTPAFVPDAKGQDARLGPRSGSEAELETKVSGVPAEAGAKGVEVFVHPAVSCWVTVVGQDGGPIPGARVDVHEVKDPDAFFGAPSRTFPPQQETDAQGRARLGGLDPDLVYTLVVGRPYARTDLLEKVETVGWRPADTRVVLGK